MGRGPVRARQTNTQHPALSRMNQTTTVPPASFSWTLLCSATGSCGVILALFLSANAISPADSLTCILLNLVGGALLTVGSAGNAVDSSEFYPFLVLNGVFALVATAALGRWFRRRGKTKTTTVPPTAIAP